MKSAGFLLESLFFMEFQVNANPDFDFDSNDPVAEPHVKVFFHSRDDRTLQMGLGYKVEIENSSDPYYINCLIVGNFIVDDDVPEPERAKKVAFSGPNMLYGSLRNQIATLTANSAWGQIIIPPVIFGPEDFYQPTEGSLE
ncbi:hypothetical protein [Pseudomonas sp. C9-3]|uniref:hypothetical protein n=1 Tax=Pseudomonas sp. C9-3 TaxID=3078264 RepID=UPI0028EF7082|nr:hypothetical protein [Pseudomonas sp. C9-3]